MEGITPELVDLRDYPLPFFEETVAPMKSNGQYKSTVAGRWSGTISRADAFIIISPEYNHGYTGVLKNALDYLYREWNNKPVGFVSYGSTGGARVIEQLRLVAIELQMLPIRNALHIPMDVYVATRNSPDPHLHFSNALKDNGRNVFGAFIDELIGLANTVKKGK